MLCPAVVVVRRDGILDGAEHPIGVIDPVATLPRHLAEDALLLQADDVACGLLVCRAGTSVTLESGRTGHYSHNCELVFTL